MKKHIEHNLKHPIKSKYMSTKKGQLHKCLLLLATSLATFTVSAQDDEVAKAQYTILG